MEDMEDTGPGVDRVAQAQEQAGQDNMPLEDNRAVVEGEEAVDVELVEALG
jgi:hypothetical protein